MGNYFGGTQKESNTSISPTPPTPSTSFSSPTRSAPFSPPTPSTPFSPSTPSTSFSSPTRSASFSPPTPSTSFSPSTPSTSFSSPTRSTSLFPPTTSTFSTFTPSNSFSSPTRSAPFSPPKPPTGTSQKQDTEKADKDFQRFLIQLIRDIGMAAYCPDPSVICTAIKLVDIFGPVNALSVLWGTYSEQSSQKQISLFHIFLSLSVKHPGIISFEEDNLSLPHNGLLYFHKNHEWILLAYLIVGVQDYPDSIFYQMAAGEDTSDLTLVEILQDFSLNIPEYIDLLIEKILVNGAPCEYLCAYGKAPALHVAAEIAAVSGHFQTFFYVLQWASTSKDQLNATDRNKQTAFERICDLVDDHPLNSKKVLTQLLDKDCQLPHNTSESCHKIPVECVDAELVRLRDILQCTNQTKDFKCATVYCRRGVDLLLRCHQVKDLSKYYLGLYDIYLDKEKKISVEKKSNKLRAAHYTFTFLNYLEKTFGYLKIIKEMDKDIGAILESVHKMEEDEVNKFLLEKSKSSKFWPMLHFFLIGTKSQEPRFKKFNASQMNISTLLESRKSNEISKSSALELLMTLLKNGLLLGHDSAMKIHKILQLTLDIGSLDALDYCLNNKNINVVNARNETLLHSLVQTEVENVQFYIKVMKLLLEKGIKKSMKDSQGRKAEDLASILKLPGALLKVENISHCTSVDHVMAQVKKLESNNSAQLLTAYCTIGQALILEKSPTVSNCENLVKLCVTRASLLLATGFTENAEDHLAETTKYCCSMKQCSSKQLQILLQPLLEVTSEDATSKKQNDEIGSNTNGKKGPKSKKEKTKSNKNNSKITTEETPAGDGAKNVKKQKCRKKNSKISNSKPETFVEIKKPPSVSHQPEISEIETKPKKKKNQEVNSLKFLPESLESEMRAKIESLSEYKCEEMNSFNKTKERRETGSERITEPDIKVDICMDFNPDVIKDCEQTGSEDEDDNANDDDNIENEDLFEENLFENLNWKVICTQDVWNTLKSRDLTDETRRKAILAIKKLASGHKSRRVRKLKDIPNNLMLYTFHLSHNSRIIWQLTINYLPELEQYSEVLCIWKVVFNLNKLRSIIDAIAKCYKASLSYPLYLKPVVSTQKQSGLLLPRVFEKCDDNKSKDLCQSYLSISSKNEVNIMKFYRFSSSLVRYIFQESTLNASFPFEVKEAESNIIVDSSKEAIIVLGRSGTGKTTCCLYRLWDHYITYWKRAIICGSPLLQKLVTNSLDQIRDKKVVGEQEEQSEEDQNEDVNDTNDDEETKDDSENYCHLHQLFISRNNCLCTEMQKNFTTLCIGENMSENLMEFSGSCFQDLQDNNFPLFLTSKKFWVLLDASLGSPYFFPRNEDLSLRTDFKNWLDEDSNNLIDMDIKENDHSGNFQDFYEVTYDIFEKEFWNRIKYPVPGCHPTLIWTEIMSIIKGSYKSLLSEKGFLSKEEYMEIGKKQAPNFTSDREKVYQAFVKYNKLLRERHLFDEMDVVFNLFSRLRNSQSTFCPIHEIYVDEVQDFTQAELFLMILLVENPNDMFLTGDTAQSIMRGVAFRFCDLKSLFHYLKEICSNLKQLHSINVPQKMHYLTCNYRSHSGVISLASSVLDLLNRYFPESFDKTQKDFGTYEGPKPKIFEFCSNEDLAMLLAGDKQTTDLIEFGAQQAILVANNQAKQELPSFLSSAIVLTIAESKGLEFNDILLYNFFKDSLVTDEWRIITSYLQEIISETNEDKQGNGRRSNELDLDVLDSQNHPHPLTFDPNKHKVLNTELKYLYTALTRAKHNIWIFDKSNEKRTPIFEYFQVLRLVASVDTSSEDPGNTEFARSSTPEEWFMKGMSFIERNHFEIAIKCFQKSGHKKEENVATAFLYVQQAQTQESTSKKQKNFLMASKYFFDYDMHIRSAWCLSEGGKYELSARLYQKYHKYKEAAVNFKNAKMYEDAVQCYLKISFYGKAVDVLHDAKQYSYAIELIQEYKSLEQSYGDSATEEFKKNCPTKDIVYLAQQAANLYYQLKDFEKMKAALRHFPTFEDELNFLEKKRLFKDAAELLRNNGQIQSSMDLLWQNNLFSESVAVAATLNDNNLYADCLYKQAAHNYVVAKLRRMRVDGEDSQNVDIDTDLAKTIEEDLRNALLLYKKENNNFGLGKCHLLLAKLNETNTKCTIDAMDAFKHFKSVKVPIGCLEAVQFFTDLNPHDFYKESFWNVIKESSDLVNLLKSPLQSSNIVIKSYLPYFGLLFKDDCVWKSHTTEPLCCISLIEYNVCNSISYASFTFDKFKSWLNKYLKSCIRKLFQILYHKLIIHIIISTPCPFESAELCQSSETCRCHLANFYGIQLGNFCRSERNQCMHLHKSSTLTHLDICVVICEMLLTINLSDFLKSCLEEFKFFTALLYKALISNVDQSIHLSDFLHPDNITALKICIRNHYKMILQKKTLLEKVQLSDLYFEVNILFSWLNIRYDLNKFMQDMCKQIEDESFPNVSILNSSLVSSNGIYTCIYQRFYESLYFLYEKHQPFEAVIQFSKFCVLLVKKRKRILPDLHCLIMRIEFFMTVSFMLLMRHCRISVVLPSSHVSSTELLDTFQSTEKLQDILNSCRMWLSLKLLEERVTKMVNLIFTDNIFQCLQRDVNSRKLAKRVYILGLCYINCFSEKPFENIPDLGFLMKCENVKTLVDDPLLRVKDVCKLIETNKTEACRLIKDTLKVLMQIKEYKIFRYYWMFKNGKPLGLQWISDKQSPMLKHEIADTGPTVVPESDTQITEKMVEVLINNEEANKRRHRLRQTKAVQVIEDAYRRYRNKLLEELKSLEIPIDLPIVIPSEKYCSICAASFSSKQWMAPLKITVTNNGNNSSDENETLFKHLKKPAHLAKVCEFKTFSELYETYLLPVKAEAKNYLEVDLASNKDEIKFYFDLLKLKLQDFNKNMEQICQNANWTETEKLETIARNIEHFSGKIQNTLARNEPLI